MIVPLRYDGEGVFTALRGHWKRLDRELVIGEIATWEQKFGRSTKSHDHYFALVRDARKNLPESLDGVFLSDDHLRKFALIKAGYCTETKMVFQDKDGALRACAFMQGLDPYAICEPDGCLVTMWRAQSQSMKSMDGATFQKSKEAVLQVISEMIGSDASKAGSAA
jgi:hypothetical protein